MFLSEFIVLLQLMKVVNENLFANYLFFSKPVFVFNSASNEKETYCSINPHAIGLILHSTWHLLISCLFSENTDTIAIDQMIKSRKHVNFRQQT